MAHEHGEAFPREETSELVGAALRADQRRAWIQDLSITLALALLALGLPLERLVGRWTPDTFPSVSDDLDWVRAQFGRHVERIEFLFSALFFALGWLVLARAARRQGWDSGSALRASLLAACAPVVLFAATTSGPAAAGWLGACVVLATLVDEKVGPATRTVAWLAASFLHPWNIWLWPAWLLRERRGRVWCVGAGLAVGLALLRHLPHRPRDLFAGLDGGPGPAVAWWTLWIAGLGGAAVGLVALRRSPPLWILAFALVPLAALSLGGTIGHDLPWIWLAPLAWLGVLELEKRGQRTGPLLAGSLLCAAAALVWIRATDPERAWRGQAEALLEPQDIVLTLSREHHYLIGTRHGMRVWMLPSRWEPGEGTRSLEKQLREARVAGRRIVLDEDSLGPAAERLCDEATFEWAARAADLRLGPR